MLLLASLACVIALTSCATYIPPVYYGNAISAVVAELQAPDFRAKPVYLVNFDMALNATGDVVSSLVHRNYDEFVQLTQLIPGRKLYPWMRWDLPSEENVTIADLNALLTQICAIDEARLSVEFGDFLGINWNADDVGWFENLKTFMHMLLFARLPLFQPEPPVFESEADVFVDETAFEKYIYMMAFRVQDDLDRYMEYFESWVDTNPAFAGPADDSDVWFPGADGPLALPYHFTKTFVHFLPGGYVNGKTVRISYTGNTKFNFLKEDIVRDTIQSLYGDMQFSSVLDIGTGNCYSAFVFGEEYPDAQVYGIDLAAPYVRFCNMWKERRPGSDNVLFYQDNAELTHFPDESFDLIQYSYVIHEMPEVNAEMVVREAMRLLKPGGIFSGFEVPFIENVIIRQISIQSQTWGCHWNETECDFGPEPYMEEYEAGTKLPRMLEREGFVNNTFIDISNFDGIYVSYKPW